MTNIQAIDLLKGLEQSLDDYCELNDEGKTAFRMAITSLELFGNTEQLPSAQPETAKRTAKSEHYVSNDDLISRKAVIEVLDRTQWLIPYAKNVLKDHVRILPSAPSERWIPCGERLPEDFEEVNITWINTDPEPYYDFVKGKPFTGSAVYYKGRWFWYSAVCTDYLREYGFSPNDLMDDSIKVIAWMPLPEPYKGEQE